MSKPSWLQSVEEELLRHDYMAGVERTAERVKATGEVFTPTALVLEMCQYLDLELFAPGKTVLDPACGDGQFLVAAKAIKMRVHGMPEPEALADIYGVDVMRDNVDLCLRRLGGGTIIMGNSLSPSQQLPGQTDAELRIMLQLFDLPTSAKSPKKRRLAKVAPKTSSSQEDTDSLLLF